MTDQTWITATGSPDNDLLPSGEIVTEGVSAEDFSNNYEGHYEWVQGYVIKMSPVSLVHDRLVEYIRTLLKAYFSLQKIGTVVGDPFTMRLDEIKSQRQPDLQIILEANAGNLTDKAMVGAADICVEVVSEGSTKADYGEKLIEYEAGGVREYWIVDPRRKAAYFHRLNADGIYNPELTNNDGEYSTPLLPGLRLHVSTLWQDELPDFFAIGQAVQDMLKA